MSPNRSTTPTMIVLTKLVLFLSVFIKLNECSNILLVTAIKCYSHVAPLVELAKALTEKGHNVTLISMYQVDTNLSFRNIVVENSPITDAVGAVGSVIDNFRVSKMTYVKRFLEFGRITTEDLLNDSKVKEILSNPNENFDIVIIDLFTTFALQGFCHHFKAHCIMYTTVRINTVIKPLVGDTPSLSYSPDTFTGFNKNLSFFERLYNLGIYFYLQFLLHYSYLPIHDALLKRHFKDDPDVLDIAYNISLVLQNSHISINSPAPEPPNVVEIGGFHIKPDNIGSLEVKKYLDLSRQDVAYFCMGSIIKMSQLSDDMINSFLKAFSKLKNVSILWKSEETSLKKIPDNVKIVSWAPQKYILAHPNVKLFITHGGIHSIMEAVYFGKPVLGIPACGDQFSNLKYLESIGMGKYIDFEQITEDVVATSIEDILKNTSFSENAQKNSKLFRDQPMHPMDKAIYWIEFVQRQNGGSRLALESWHFPLYKRLLLDVIFFILCISIALLLLIINCISFVKNRLITECKVNLTEKLKVIEKQKKDS